MKYTKGPWENCNGDIRAKWETGEEITIANTGSTRFCGNESGGPKDIRMRAENKGNAQLISAAPELADALERLVRLAPAGVSSGFKGAVYAAHAAIAKAKGE
jgi:hypothetical protein